MEAKHVSEPLTKSTDTHDGAADVGGGVTSQAGRTQAKQDSTALTTNKQTHILDIFGLFITELLRRPAVIKTLPDFDQE